MIAIILHLHYQDLWPEIRNKVQSILNDEVHLYVTINEKTHFTENVESKAKRVFLLENKGSDFGPFVYVWNQIKDLDYKYVLKIHGKKSECLKNKEAGKKWRLGLINPLLYNKTKFDRNIFFMEQNPNIYMIGAKKYYYDRYKEPINSKNRADCQEKIEKLLKHVNSCDHGCFFAGAMFLVTTDYLKKFFENCDLDFLYDQFENYHTKNGQLAHAMERVIGYGVEHHGGKFLLLD